MATKLSEATADQLVEFYVRLRERRSERKKFWEAEDAQDAHKMERVEQKLQEKLNADGAESGRTPHGTYFKQSEASCTVADKEAFFNNWVIPNQRWDLLDIKANKTGVRALLEEGQDLPPGLNFSVTEKIRIRRA